MKLRPYQESDFEFLKNLRNDPSIQLLLLCPPIKYSDEQIKEWINRRSTDGVFFVIASDSDVPMGFTHLVDIDTVPRLGICIHPTFQGQGIGTEAMQYIHKYVKEVLKAKKIRLRVLSVNYPAMNLYKHAGYQLVDPYKDVLTMEILL